MKYAGSPWELGLSEAQQVLRANGLRGRVRVQTDGGLKTGLDVIKAAILGAESFGFGTGPMVALGCKYLRICHLNNCATGVATQNEKLRKDHFIGLPDMVVNYFKFVAEETRELMAALGIRKLTDLIGRTDLLDLSAGDTPRQGRLKLDVLLSPGRHPGRRAALLAAGTQPLVRQGRAGRADGGRRAGRDQGRHAGSNSPTRCATSTARSARACRAKSPRRTAARACRTTPSASA